MNEGQAISGAYHSPVREARAAETRERILGAARRLFIERGYGATSLADVAAAAGVSVQTIYNSVGGKAALLLVLNDGIDAAANVTAIQRRIAECVEPAEVVALTAGLRRRLMESNGELIKVLMEAAPSDPEVAVAWEDGKARSRAGARRIAERLAELGGLRAGLSVSVAADAMYGALHHGVWTCLVDECGWSADQFEAWCADLLARLLLPDAARTD